MAEIRQETTQPDPDPDPDPSTTTIDKEETANSSKTTDVKMLDDVSAETTGGDAIATEEPPKDATTDGKAEQAIDISMPSKSSGSYIPQCT